ncbi:hypothetical protein QBC32DRAFT_109996 [Pseudoneurospora amorphoporcata]|uniref:Mid2 domain-containing protein n=1 Tax=Pseudoneurospora amorphoporcata TaxID=241081 RepID=A0AAN6SKH7_9PEZI|nr:hypothetical protein QBC32DRAFT_109996 [Pseudoneurospora amorphoporcata]
MQVIRPLILHAALAAAQLSEPGGHGTSSGDNALTASSSLPTEGSSSNTFSKSSPAVSVDSSTEAETPVLADPEADHPVRSTGVNDEELEGAGSPQYLMSNRPAASESVQPETAPPEEATVQDLGQAVSPPTETTGVFRSDSPGTPIASTPVVASVPSATLVETSTVTPSPAEATDAAILAVPDSSSQVLETQSPSISTSATPTTATKNKTSTILAPPSTTFLSIKASSTDPASLEFIAIATNSSSSLTLTTPSPTDSVPAFIALATDSSSSSSPSPSFHSYTSSSSSSTITTNTPAMAASTTNTSVDASLDTSLNNTKSSSNEYLSSQAKVAIALVSVVGVLAVMAVIGYVLWHMRMRDARLGRNQAALARGVGGGGASDGADKGKGTGEAVPSLGGGKGGSGHKRNLSVEEKMKQALEKEHDVPLNIGKLQSEAQDGVGKDVGKTAAKATTVNRFSTFSAISEGCEESGDSRPGTQSSEGSGSQASYGNNKPLAVMASPMAMGSEDSITTASQKEAGVGYGLGRSESLESGESHYSEGGQDQFGRTETLEGQRGRYVHERSENLRSQWSDVEDYYGIERLETDVLGSENVSAGDAGGAGTGAGAGAEALGSEETLVRTESSASGTTVGKAI